MGQMLTVKQVAEVKGCRVQYIQRMAKEGKLPSVKTVNNRNQKVYQIPLESLPDELQQRWYQMQVEQMREENGIEAGRDRSVFRRRTAGDRLLARVGEKMAGIP